MIVNINKRDLYQDPLINPAETISIELDPSEVKIAKAVSSKLINKAYTMSEDRKSPTQYITFLLVLHSLTGQLLSSYENKEELQAFFKAVKKVNDTDK